MTNTERGPAAQFGGSDDEEKTSGHFLGTFQVDWDDVDVEDLLDDADLGGDD